MLHQASRCAPYAKVGLYLYIYTAQHRARPRQPIEWAAAARIDLARDAWGVACWRGVGGVSEACWKGAAGRDMGNFGRA